MHGCRPGALPFLYFQTQAANNLVAEIASTATQLDIVLRFQRRPRPSPARSGAGRLAKHGVMLKDGGRISRALLVSAADLQQAHTKAARARLPGLGPSKRKCSIAAHVMAGFDQGWEYMGVVSNSHPGISQGCLRFSHIHIHECCPRVGFPEK